MFLYGRDPGSAVLPHYEVQAVSPSWSFQRSLHPLQGSCCTYPLRWSVLLLTSIVQLYIYSFVLLQLTLNNPTLIRLKVCKIIKNIALIIVNLWFPTLSLTLKGFHYLFKFYFWNVFWTQKTNKIKRIVWKQPMNHFWRSVGLPSELNYQVSGYRGQTVLIFLIQYLKLFIINFI